MSYNQYLGLSFGSGSAGGGGTGGARGPKGDPGSFVWSFGNPPNLTRHLEIHSQPEYVALHRPILPSASDTIDLGSENARFGVVHTQTVSANEVRYVRGGTTNPPVRVSYDETGRQQIRIGEDYQVFGVTTSRVSPNKIDPSLLDITGLRFVNTIYGDADLQALLAEHAATLRSGDYFVITTDGLLTYDHFENQNDRHATRGDILVFTSSPNRFVKIPVRIPDYGISTTHLADRSVTSTKLATAAVSRDHLADASVTSSKLDSSLEVERFRVLDSLSARTFCTNTSEESVETDPLANPKYGITFAESVDQIHEGTWRIQSSLDSMKFQIWTGNRWVDKFELR